jgi:glycosyltransferase involved in cell wall biosynthesis
MANPLVSIVVPVYNVEKYLPRCLDSIVAQDYRPIELVIVDDGSPDGCPAIIDDYGARYPFIQTLHQRNQGLGAARNNGIRMASGRYVALVDSDDYVEPGFVGGLVSVAEARQADVAICDFFVDFPNGFRVPFPLLTLQSSLSGEEAAQASLNLLRLPAFAWNKLYRRELFTAEDIRFPAIYYEDIATMPRVLLRARTVAVVQKPYYHYCLRRTSITGNFGPKNIRDYLQAVDIIRQFLFREHLWEAWQRQYRSFLRLAETQLLIQVTVQETSISPAERRELIREIHEGFRSLQTPPQGGSAPFAEASSTEDEFLGR